MRSRDGDDANDGDVDGLLVPLAPTPLDCPTTWMKKLRRRQPRLGRRVLLALFVFIILGAFVGHKADASDSSAPDDYLLIVGSQRLCENKLRV